MQKVYRLLRNNQQTGPYSLDELMQLGLKPHDLIWVEGKSGGWSYPSEIDTLKPYLPGYEAPKVYTPAEPVVERKLQPKNVFVSMPKGSSVVQEPREQPALSIEQKAEALRQRAQSYIPAENSRSVEEPLKTNYTRSLNDVEEEYTSWVYNKKTKKKSIPAKKIASTAVIVFVLALSVYGLKSLFFDNDAKQAGLTVHNNLNPVPVNNSSAVDDKEYSNEGNNITPVSEAKKKEKPKEDKTANKQEAKTVIPKQPAENEYAVNSNEPVEGDEITQLITEEKKEETTTETAKEKKRTFKETISNIFKKKPVDDTQNEGSETTTSGERRARKRSKEFNNDQPAVTQEAVNITAEVEARLNVPENWMMGIKGLKVTLYNRSSVVLKSASVEVLYYNEQNSLIEKKRLQFSDIAAGKSKTIAAPDHRLADHADVKVLSATGVEIAYAKN